MGVERGRVQEKGTSLPKPGCLLECRGLCPSRSRAGQRWFMGFKAPDSGVAPVMFSHESRGLCEAARRDASSERVSIMAYAWGHGIAVSPRGGQHTPALNLPPPISVPGMGVVVGVYFGGTWAIAAWSP